MDASDRFEMDLIDLATRGVVLSVANVARHLGLGFAEAERRLDELANRGRLDLELNENTGALFYVVRGLDVRPAPSPPTALAVRPFVPPPVVVARKSRFWGVALALMIPGLGLAYAAPWSIALGGGFVLWVLVHGFAAVPLVGPLLSSVVLGIGALASVVLSLRYVDRFNRTGRRTHLDALPTIPGLDVASLRSR